MTSHLQHLRSWRPGPLAANALGGMLGYGTRLGLQAAYFLLLARLLGSEGFGLFAGIWVLAGLMSALAGQGFQVLTMRTAALAPETAAACMARGLRVVATLAPGLIVIFVLAALAFFPGPPPLLALFSLAMSEIGLVAALGIISGWHQGSERLGRSQLVVVVLWVVRLGGLLSVAAFGSTSFVQIALMHGLTTFAVATFWYLHHRSQIPLHETRWPSRSEWMLGASFCASTISLIAFTELNQSLTLATAGASAAAMLAVSYKVASLFAAPVSALCQAISPRLLRAADAGPSQMRALGRGLFMPVGMLAVACMAGAWLFASWIPDVFGSTYQPAIQIAKMFCVLPLFASIRMLSTYAIVASSRQGLRVAAETSCMVLGLLVNSMLIHSMGLNGAVVGTLVVEGLTAVALAAVAWRALGRSQVTLASQGSGYVENTAEDPYR